MSEDNSKEFKEGTKRFLNGEKLGVSTDISGSPTYGYGKLDNNGYWEFPVPEWVIRLNRKNYERG